MTLYYNFNNKTYEYDVTYEDSKEYFKSLTKKELAEIINKVTNKSKNWLLKLPENRIEDIIDEERYELEEYCREDIQNYFEENAYEDYLEQLQAYEDDIALNRELDSLRYREHSRF